MSLSSDAGSAAPPLDAETLRRIESYARTVGATPHQVIREAVEEYLSLHEDTRDRETPDETVFDVLQRAGLIGCIPGAPGSPTDLSTNPIHREGFGGE
jgi:hypothetical protein